MGGKAQPVVSVIIPVYNEERYLTQCLDSVLGQTLKDIEIICVDDGSTDGSLTILKQYVQLDGRVRLLRQTNQYAGVARNRGLDEARGEYVIFLDSDDFFEPELLERTVLAARERNADIVIFGGMRYDDAAQKVSKKNDFLRRDLLPKKLVFSRIDVPNTIFMLTNPAPWCRLYARRFLLKTGLRFQALPNANDFFFTLSSMALAERITAVDADLVYYRVNISASLQQNKHKSPLCILYALDALYQELTRRNLFELLQTSFRYRGLSSIFYNLTTVKSDEARLQILEALNSEPFCRFPLREAPEKDNGSVMARRYSLQLSAACDWYHRSERICALTEKHIREKEKGISAKERNTVPVSVIIPVYNTASYLEETLNSISNQTLKEIEIICINDGSTDESLDILERWAARDSRIVLFSQPNEGQGSARNLGISHAKGKFLYFMDSDDVLEKGALEQLVTVMEEKTLDVLYFDGKTFYDNEELAAAFSDFQNNYSRSRAYDDVYDGATLFRKFSEEGEYFASSCLQILRTDFVRGNAIFFLPGILYEDNPFTFEVLLKAKRASHLQCVYFHRRIRGNSIMTKPVTFLNAYSYYRCFHAMLHTYYEVKPNLTPENCNAALRRITMTLRNAQSDYAKMTPESIGSELGLRESLFTFQTLVRGDEKRKIKDLNDKLNRAYAEKSEINRKLQKTYKEKSERGLIIKKLNKKLIDIQSGYSFRVGRVITFIPRKILGGVKCYSQHGLVYTIKRCTQKFKNFLK